MPSPPPVSDLTAHLGFWLRTVSNHVSHAFAGRLAAQGVRQAFVTLHVGLGTFRPVSEDNVEDHHMHSEYYECSEEAARAINEARASGGSRTARIRTAVVKPIKRRFFILEDLWRRA